MEKTTYFGAPIFRLDSHFFLIIIITFCIPVKPKPPFFCVQHGLPGRETDLFTPYQGGDA